MTRFLHFSRIAPPVAYRQPNSANLCNRLAAQVERWKKIRVMSWGKTSPSVRAAKGQAKGEKGARGVRKGLLTFSA